MDEEGAPCLAGFARQPALSEAEGWDSTDPSLRRFDHHNSCGSGRPARSNERKLAASPANFGWRSVSTLR
jgi:hypothetical protein